MACHRWGNVRNLMNPVNEVEAMKAIRLYGSRDGQDVVLEEVPVPEAGPGEVRVRVHAAAITPGELHWYPTWHTRQGTPRVRPVPSHEFSGVIEAVGPDVTGLRTGDPVYGLND